MTDLRTAYAAYYSPSNSTLDRKVTNFEYGKTLYSEVPHEVYQEHKKFADPAYDAGFRDVFGHDDHTQEPVGIIFFGEENIKRLQKKIKDTIYLMTNKKIILDEDQDPADLLIAMRGVYQLHGRFLKERVVHQVKDLNDKLVKFIIPDMITEIKQYYGYLRDVNEPLKPIDRPMNVSNAGRRTLPSVTSLWSRF